MPFQKRTGLGRHLPSWLSMVFSLSLVGFLLKVLVNIISNDINEVILVSSRYQEESATLVKSC